MPSQIEKGGVALTLNENSDPFLVNIGLSIEVLESVNPKVMLLLVPVWKGKRLYYQFFKPYL